jgi:hypothetical protein
MVYVNFAICYALAVIVTYAFIMFLNELEDIRHAFDFLRRDPQPLLIPEREG